MVHGPSEHIETVFKREASSTPLDKVVTPLSCVVQHKGALFCNVHGDTVSLWAIHSNGITSSGGFITYAKRPSKYYRFSNVFPASLLSRLR